MQPCKQKEVIKTDYERHLEALKKWNERRAMNEKQGLEKFYKLRETFKKPILIFILFLSSCLFSCKPINKVVNGQGKYYIINCQNDTLNIK